MTVPAASRRSPVYDGNDTATSFGFSFKVFAATDITVVRTNTDGSLSTLVLSSDYSVALNADQTVSPGGTVTYPISGSPLATGEKLVIIGDLPYNQPLGLPPGGNYNPRALENELDRQVMQIQQVADGVASALRAPLGETLDELPDAATRANTVQAYDSDGNPTVQVPVSGSAADVLIQLANTANPALGANLVGIKGPESNEVARTVYLNLIEVKRVSRWDVLPSESAANNRTRLQNAINSATRRELVFDEGAYSVNDLLTVPNGAQIYMTGQGVGVSRLIQTDLTKGLLKWNLNLDQGGGLRGLTLGSNVAAGAQGSTGVGLHVQRANDNFAAEDFSIESFDKGLRCEASFQPRFSRFRVLYFADYGILLPTYTGAGTDGAGSDFRSGKVSNFGFLGSAAASIGIDIQQASGEFFDTVDVTSANIGIRVAPPAASFARYLFMSKVLADTCLTNGWLFDGTNAPVVANDLAQCWASNTQGAAGVRVLGANLDDLKWMGGWVRDGREIGVQLAGGTRVKFIGTVISRNSAAANDTYDGVSVAAGVSDWSFIGCTIGNVSQTVNPSTQRHGINIAAGASQNFFIIGCDLRSPGAGGLPVNNGSSSANYVIRDNLPQQFAGTNNDRGFNLNGVSNGTIAAALTRYLGPVGAQANEGDAFLMVGRPGIVNQLVVEVDAAPGAAQTFTYTVRKNGVATAMTGAISGAASFQLVNANSFTYSAADRLSLEVVTSAGAAAARHRWVINGDA